MWKGPFVDITTRVIGAKEKDTKLLKEEVNHKLIQFGCEERRNIGWYHFKLLDRK